MAVKSSYELHHHFPRLAEESGFAFNVHRPRLHIDWNKFRLIDIESLIRERKFGLIEQHLNDILQCALESEFDVRILDEGVVKMFRLAQLAIEYQQFCRHYLDRSVFVLREEITALAQELDATKKELREKDDEIRKLKRKTKYTSRPPLPYGNENIATMILKTLANKGDIFPTTSHGDSLQYNKCSYCDKVFLNQLYLQSHLARRHPYVTEIPQRDVTDNNQTLKNEQENSRLNEEVMELKSKLKEMELLITKASGPNNSNPDKKEPKVDSSPQKETKDAEVSTNSEVYLLDKIEEWKREEHEKYNKEINLLRTQILETIISIKDKENPKPSQSDTHIIEQLHATIQQQGAEMVLLKNELINSKINSQTEESEKKKEAEAQMTMWTKRAEAQTKQYELLLQKLNDVAQEARESRAIAESERERANQLQVLLQQSLDSQSMLDKSRQNPHIKEKEKVTNVVELPTPKKPKHKKPDRKESPVADRNTLESLHRKAQELLNIGSTDSPSEPTSSSVENQPANVTEKKASLNKKLKIQNVYTSNKNKENYKHSKINSRPAIDHIENNRETTVLDPKENKRKPKRQNHPKVGNGVVITPGSPLKLVRARLTEEVNNRLVSAGVDPLKSRMPQQIFQKQRIHLQQQVELKSKKNPEYEKTRHSILSFLDSTTSIHKKSDIIIDKQDYTSPSKLTKPFSFTNVISNVKSKALSLVKSNDITFKNKHKTLNPDVARRAMSLLKTAPDSMNTSPVLQRKLIDKKGNSARDDKPNLLTPKSKFNSDPNIMENARKIDKSEHTADDAEDSDNDDDETNESDHKYYNSATTSQATKSIESLIKSPARRPSANADYNRSVRKYIVENEPSIPRTQSEANISHVKEILPIQNHESSDDLESLMDIQLKKAASEDTMKDVPKQTKGVLKNASSISSLSKKKVLFDMDAIQMKSVSASPSQSTEKSEANDVKENFELGLVNLDGEEWDISSIENEPLKNDTKVNTRMSPKIAELKQSIESQLARRNDTPTNLAGGVNLMPTLARASSVGGSNTSLGSSILDDSDEPPVVNQSAFVKPRKITEKDDSEIDISEYSLDGISNKKGNDSF